MAPQKCKAIDSADKSELGSAMGIAGSTTKAGFRSG